MSSDIKIGKYYAVNSKIHDLSALTKIVCMFIFVIFILMSYNLKLNILISFLLAILLLLSNVPIKLYLNSILYFKWLILFIFIINLFLGNSLYLTIITILRIIYTTQYGLMVLFTTELDDLTSGLEHFLMPLKLLKIPIRKMVFSISLALHFIPILLSKANTILKSLANRGMDYKKSGFTQKLFILKYTIIPMFVLSIRKADVLADVMEIRLYDINKKQKYYIKFRLFEVFLIILHLSLLCLIVKEQFL